MSLRRIRNIIKPKEENIESTPIVEKKPEPEPEPEPTPVVKSEPINLPIKRNIMTKLGQMELDTTNLILLISGAALLYLGLI